MILVPGKAEHEKYNNKVIEILTDTRYYMHQTQRLTNYLHLCIVQIEPWDSYYLRSKQKLTTF